jgi:natural product precursor
VGGQRNGPLQSNNPEEKYGDFLMKKTIKKLTLAKETLRNLNEDQMADVAGGVPSKRYSDCGSCGIACTYIDCTT